MLRAALELNAACAARGIAVRLDLVGGEAMASRGEIAIRRRFLASDATHLFLADSEVGFSAGPLVAALERGAGPPPGLILLTREEVQAAAPAADLRFGDIR